MSALPFIVCHIAPGREGSMITRAKTYARAASKARKHHAATGEDVGVWSNVTDRYTLTLRKGGAS